MGRRRAEPEPEELDDDLDETERGEAETEPAAPKAARATPEETRALDRRIFDAADRLAKLGRSATLPEIADAAKVPGSSADARRMRVAKALRRRALLTPAAPRPPKVQSARVARAPAPAPPPPPVRVQPDQAAQGVRAVEALRDRLRRQLEAAEVTLAALRGES